MVTRFKKIPAPNSLITFEVCARHLSFTRAAFELNLTQAAVSKQMSTLEDRLGKCLFERKHRAIVLTPAGNQLLHAVQEGMTIIVEAVEGIQQPKDELTVTLAATTAFAQMWLLPRIGQFRQQYPNIHLRLLTTEQHFVGIDEGADLAIKYGDDSWRQSQAEFLLSGEIMPVCHPEFAKRYQLLDIQQLKQVPLLDLGEDHNWRWVNWPNWLRHSGLDMQLPAASIEFNNIPMLYSAAEAGQGVALGWSEFVEGLIKQGRLIAPFQESVRMPKPWGYYLLQPHNQVPRAEVTAVISWIAEQASG